MTHLKRTKHENKTHLSCAGLALTALLQPTRDRRTFSPKKPNILVIMGDYIGWFNPSCYNSGIMGYQTPYIDRIAKEGARFTDWYGRRVARRDARRSSQGIPHPHRTNEGRPAGLGYRPAT